MKKGDQPPKTKSRAFTEERDLLKRPTCIERGIPTAQNEAGDLENRPKKRPRKETQKRDLETRSECIERGIPTAQKEAGDLEKRP